MAEETPELRVVPTDHAEQAGCGAAALDPVAALPSPRLARETAGWGRWTWEAT